jgi:hypothetical protein
MNAAYCGVPVLLMFYSCVTNLYVYDDVVIQFVYFVAVIFDVAVAVVA